MKEIIEGLLAIGNVEVSQQVSRIEAIRERTGLPLSTFLDTVARHVAHGYHHRRISFEDGDSVMNRLFWSAVSNYPGPSPDNAAFPPYMWSVYFAFDVGEGYKPGDSRDVDPAEKYTRPLIAEIVSRDMAAEHITTADASRG